MKHLTVDWDKLISTDELPKCTPEGFASQKGCSRHVIYPDYSVPLDDVWSSSFGINIPWILRHASTSIATPSNARSSALRPPGNTDLCCLSDVSVFSPAHAVYLHSEQRILFPRTTQVLKSGLDATDKVDDRLYYSIFFYEKMLYIDDPVFLFSSKWSSNNYYHWIIDCVPKILHFKRLLTLFPNLKLLLLEDNDKPYHCDFLAFHGIGTEQIVRARHNSVYANKLFYMSRIGPDSHSPDLNKELAKALIPMKSMTSDTPRRIYIARRKGTERSIQNSVQLQLLLEKLGFCTIFMENYSLAQQIAIVADAEVILGPHGAGLTLTSVGFPDISRKFIIELTHTEPLNPCFFFNSLANGSLNHVLLPSRKVICNSISLIDVDLQLFEAVVSEVLFAL